VWQRRCGRRRGLSWALGWFVLLLVASVGCAPTRGPARSDTGIRVLLVGDSLAYEAAGYFSAILSNYDATVSAATVGGTALCDWLPLLPSLLATNRPTVVELEFYGDNFTPCTFDRKEHAEVGPELVANYAAAAGKAAREIHGSGAYVIWVSAPVAASDDPRPEQISNAEYQASRSIVPEALDDAGEAVLAHGRFTWTLPCLPTEPCPTINGRSIGAVVRSEDGLHFCPTDERAQRGVTGPCSVWSSGAWRFAAAMAAAVTKHFGLQQEQIARPVTPTVKDARVATVPTHPVSSQHDT
jgi:hypothetical protein